MSNALYRMLQSALWFYKKLKADLKKYGFIANPYAPCVVNTMINGKHMVVIWYANDLKVSHEDTVETTKFTNYLGYLTSIYGKKW